VTSTNDIALEWAARKNLADVTASQTNLLRAPHGALVFAEEQTRGRGRLGRHWESQSGLNLTFSLVLRPDVPVSSYPLFTLAAGKSVHAVLRRHWPTLATSIKWPNDILVDRRKCAGILLESSIGPRPEENVVILGIGLNVNQTVFPADIEHNATSLLLETGQLQDRLGILVDVLIELETQIQLFIDDPIRFKSEYESVLEGIGRTVSLKAHEGTIFGRILGITDGGALWLDTDSGERIVYAGDVTFEHEKPH
jgi:BirA family biotin operon repressor/biotin-[acetyl-CoA-carboxylase] ligase